MARRTKIIATIGPTSEHPDVIRSMILAGMDVARIGLAHGTVGQAIEKMQTIRRVAEELGRNIGVMADLPGPKVRLGAAPEGGLLLTDGMVVRIQVGEEGSTTEVLTVDYPRLLEDVRVGDTLAVGDGFPTITITGQKGDSLIGTVHGEALINGRKGLHIPSDRLTMATPTAEDLLYLDALVDAEVDMVALSFIRSAHDVRRAGVEPHPRGPLIVAKIETRAAVENLAGIIESCGAIMVARGDLGIECGIEELPHIQKMIIRECIASGRPVITATQMMESMIQSSSPTRAEVTDVANAIFDGTSGVMLSAETAVGVDPTNAVATMGRIAARADQAFDYDRWPRTMRDLTSVQRDTGARVTDAISGATWRAATELGCSAIICLSDSGFTVRAIARFRPSMPIIGLSTSPRTVQQLSLSWGVDAMVAPSAPDRNASVHNLAILARDKGAVRSGDLVAVSWGSEAGGRQTDSLRLIRVP